MKKQNLIIALILSYLIIFIMPVGAQTNAKNVAPVKVEQIKVKKQPIKAETVINTTIAVVDTAANIIAQVDTSAIRKSNLPDSTKDAITATVKAAGELAVQSETLKDTLSEEKGKTSLYEKIQAIIMWLIGLFTLLSLLSKSIHGLSEWFDIFSKLNKLMTWIVKLFNKKGIVGTEKGIKGTYKEVFIPDTENNKPATSNNTESNGNTDTQTK